MFRIFIIQLIRIKVGLGGKEGNTQQLFGVVFIDIKPCVRISFIAGMVPVLGRAHIITTL